MKGDWEAWGEEGREGERDREVERHEEREKHPKEGRTSLLKAM